MVKAAAERDFLNASQWLSRAVTAALEAKGFTVEPQQYALVSPAGELVHGTNGNVIMTFLPHPDDRGEWLPVENEDSEPFDPAKHWRGKPLPLRVDGERVVRTYPIVPKTMEHA
jgi:hypothetical protein